VARKFLIPGRPVGLVFLIVHVRLMPPERIAVADLSPLIPGMVNVHAHAMSETPRLKPDEQLQPCYLGSSRFLKLASGV
jgi:hypothetical protein